MPKVLDLTGQKFGRLTALYRDENKNGRTYWVCQCECGTIKSIQTTHLRSGAVTSCGCKLIEHNLQQKEQKSKIMNNFSDEEFANIVKTSFSYAEIVKKCGYTNVSGASEKIIKTRIENQNLSIEHFTRKSPIKRTIENVFIENSTAAQRTLRTFYIQGNYSPYKCAICGQEPIWNGKELTLTLDHINGHNHDNRLENLRWICPNCDRQLDTFGSRNYKKKNIEQ